MFAEVSKSWTLLVAAGMLPVVFVTFFMLGGWNRQTKQPTHNLSGGATTESSSMETMKSSLAQDRKLLAGYEREQSALRAEVIRRRRLFQDGQISKDQVLEAERSFRRVKGGAEMPVLVAALRRRVTPSEYDEEAA